MSDSQAYAGTATLPDAANEWSRTSFMVRQIMAGMATAAIVQVVKVSGQSVDVRPMVNQMDGSGNGVDHGVIHNLPFVRLQAGTCAVIMDPVANDIGLAVFAHSDTSTVKATKRIGNPGSKRKFDWADGIYIGGLLNPDPTSFVRFNQSGELQIQAAGPIRLVAPTGVISLTSSMVRTSEALAAGNGATGSFTSQDGKAVTVVAGIITKVI